ncbi:hypothetical protein CRG98_014601 [Punica granatum]|uniref:Plant heme peroxidase family profile domain-containing protein n=1 Tax=Punica granatum TaxID=22663 RepID=A0A2I0KB51_PUNGR|nr:hypothetical protein CRG98_014601 [Punica granatum]
MLRLVFHDAGTYEMYENSGGMNGSIVYELDRPENAGLKKSLKVLEKAKTEVDAKQQGNKNLDILDPDSPGRLPQESLDASALKQTQELVTLSGAHTLGGKGFGNPNVFDNSYYKILLEKPWSSAAGMSSMIGLPSDRALAEDNECLRWIKAYADDQNLFFKDFKDAYIKLVNSGAKWRSP